MTALAARLPALVVAGWLLVAVPLLGRSRYRRLSSDPSNRLAGYRAGMTRPWLLAAAALASLAVQGVTPAAIGMSGHIGHLPALLPGLALAVALGLAVTLWLRRRPRSRRRLLRPVAALLPVSLTERRTFVAVALTAGVTEELLYRGFLNHLARQAGFSLGTAALITSIGFGLAHAYQGALGMAATGVAGYALAGLAHASGGLLLPMVVHALVDLRVLLLLPALSAPRREKRPAPS